MKVTGYKDYLEKVYEEFEDVDQASIRMVVRHGLHMLGLYRSRDLDIYLNSNNKKEFIFLGKATHSDEYRKARHNKMIRRKLRMVEAVKNKNFDHSYFFGLSEEDYQRHLKGEKIEKVHLYRVRDEITINQANQHYFKVTIPERRSWYFREDEYETTNAQYLQRRDG